MTYSCPVSYGKIHLSNRKEELHMTYEIVQLEKKMAVGLSKRTNNFSPDSMNVIGGLWEQFFGKGIYSAIEHKVNQKTLGIYTEYDGDETADYTIMVGCEVNAQATEQNETVTKVIPAGKYAKFVIKGNMQQIVGEFWQELWAMDLPRTFDSDFEEYQNSDPENAEIHVYIGVK